MTALLKYRLVGYFGRNAPDCEVCLMIHKTDVYNKEGNIVDSYSYKSKAIASVAPIGGDGKDLEINNRSRFFVCRSHLKGLRDSGVLKA